MSHIDHADAIDSCPCCDKCGRYLTAWEASAAECGEDAVAGLCEDCGELAWLALVYAPTGADALEGGRS